jgi:hypothetical protein
MEKLSYDYMEMFRGILSDFPGQLESLRKEVKWAKTLRKQDRIVWLLRWLRIEVYDGIVLTQHMRPYGGGEDPARRELANKYSRLLAAEMQRLGWSERDRLYISLPSAKDSIVHFLGIPSPAIHNLVWGKLTPRQLLGSFEDAENDWKGADSDRALVPHEDDQIALRFPDGWAWWLLGRGYCPEEAKAMGHCGNVAGRGRPYERILSLRQSVRRGSEEFYEPHLTFILDTRDGSLGEMKGKGNAKPTARYHPYILRLLESDIVDKVKGGGYLPEHNFRLGDLSEEQREALAQAKPSMATFYLRLKREGASPALVADLGSAIQAGGWDPDLQGYVINQWENMSSLAEDIGNDTAKWIAKVVGGGEFIDFEYGSRSEAMEMALDACSDKTKDLVVRYLAYKYPTNLVEWLEHNNTDYSEQATEFMARGLGDPQARKWLSQLDLKVDGVLGEDKDIIEFIEFANLDDEEGTLLSAWSDATQSGTEIEMNRDFEHTANDLLDTGFPWGTMLRKKGKYFWDDPIYEVMPLAKAVEVADSGEDSASSYMEANGRYDSSEEFRLKVDEPYYGYNGWDGSAADDRISEGFNFKPEPEPEPKPEPPKKPRKPRAPRGKKSALGDIAGESTLGDMKLAYDYTEMFRGLLQDFPGRKETIDGEIAWCKRVLRKRDRITWWLRWFRLFEYHGIAHNAMYYWSKYSTSSVEEQLPQNITPAIRERLSALARKYDRAYTDEMRRLDWTDFRGGHYPDAAKHMVEHYLSLPAPEIQGLVWERQQPYELFMLLMGLEEKWKERTKGVLVPHGGDRPVLTFGGGWAIGNTGTWSTRSPRLTAGLAEDEESYGVEDYPQCLGDYEFRTTCVSEGTGRHIQEMLDNAQDCGYGEVKRHCEGLRLWEKENGYAPDGSRKGLTLRKDWSVSYGKGAYRGMPCYFVVWSAIEHVWTKKGVVSSKTARLRWEIKGNRYGPFRLSYEDMDVGRADGYHTVVVRATKDGVEVGNAIFDKSYQHIFARKVRVEEAERRQGLASAMYVFAEKRGKGVVHPSRAQSEEGQGLWSQPSRPFGKGAAAAEKEWTPWIGVDLDGTLAEEQDPFDPLTIGRPVPEMVRKVRQAVEDGVEVRVFTARLADKRLRDRIKQAIRDYTREHIGRELDSTNEKDPGLREIWDTNTDMGCNPLE